MAPCAETNTDFVNTAFDALVREYLAPINKQLRLLINFDTMVSESLHDLACFRALGKSTADGATALVRIGWIIWEVHLALTHLRVMASIGVFRLDSVRIPPA